MEMDQTTVLGDTKFGDFTLSKAAGEGQVMTCKLSDGKTFHFKYEAGCWWTDIQPPKGQKSEDLPHRDGSQPVGVAPVPTTAGRSPHYWLILAAGGLVIVMAFLYFVPSAIRDARYAFDVEAAPAAARSESARRERALREELFSLQLSAAEKAERVAKASEAHRLQVVKIMGLSLEGFTDSAESRPRELDLAILKDDAVARAWAAVRNAYVPIAELNERQRRLSAIESRLKESGPAPDDRIVLTDIASWLDAKERSLSSQSQNLDQLRTVIEATRFEERNKRRP
jgi:hypothetical protein